LDSLSPACGALVVFTLGLHATEGGTAWGSINNFDVVNDTGHECYGFEIEIEAIHTRDITYTYDWNHYGTPKLLEDSSDPAHPKVVIRYESSRATNGGWAAYTAVPTSPIAPTDGHQFTDPSVNIGGEHFGVGYSLPATNISYFWLVDSGNGALVRGPSVVVATPTFTYQPPAGAVPAQVQAVIEPPPEPRILEFGTASWVKEIRTTSHNSREVQLRDLVTDDPEDPNDRNWRNGEPDEVEVEWQLLQTEFKKADGGANGKLAGAPEDLVAGDEVITRRYEFYKYVGPIDGESGEALADRVGVDGVHGVGVKNINGTDVDLSTLEVVGEFLGAQMSAVDVGSPLGLIEHVQDGIVNEAYPTRTLVIAGDIPFIATNWGRLPAGMTFDAVSGELSGTPAEAGIFQFTVQASAEATPALRKTYTLMIAEDAAALVALPPRSTIDTVPYPLEGGSTTGDGIYTNGTEARVSATAASGFSFSAWTDNGQIVSSYLTYTFTNAVHRSLIAHFVRVPRLEMSWTGPGTVQVSWPTNFSGFELQQNSTLTPSNWAPVTNAVSVLGVNNYVILSGGKGSQFFRLMKP
jgi:hypothetical protein